MRQWCLFLAMQSFKMLAHRTYVRYFSDLQNPLQAQERCLTGLIQDLSKTQYGQTCHLKGNETYESFRHHVPIVNFETLSPYITAQLSSSEKSILTPYPIQHIEPTSGSTGQVKQIPYTVPLLSCFRTLFFIWAYDVLNTGLSLKHGKIFFSVSQTKQTSGFKDDTAYLSLRQRLLLNPWLIFPTWEKGVDEMHVTALALLAEPQLEIISIWSPNYLLTLLSYIEKNRFDFIPYLSSKRALYLSETPIDWTKLWPNLKFISAWDSALAKPFSLRLRQLFPKVWLQGKGLVATEAPMTVPIEQAKGCLPLLSVIFFEFELNNGEIKRLHELEQGEEYQLIISQPGGLTRYRIGDRVTVTHYFKNTPCLQFLGRVKTCDMVGEKLSEDWVQAALGSWITNGRYIVVPVLQSTPFYHLYTDNKIPLDKVISMAIDLDQALSKAYHYGLARRLGQLAPLQLSYVPDLMNKIQIFYNEAGMKRGDIKESPLVINLAMAKRFQQYFNGFSDKKVWLPLY